MESQCRFSIIFIAICMLVSRFHCGLISQSAIQSCDWGDSNEPASNGTVCKEKMVVSMTLKSGQGSTEALYANIRHAYLAGEEQASMLKKPFRIEVSKTQTIASYRVYYRGAANARPEESSSTFHWRGDCRDGWNDRHTSCGKQRIAGSDEYEWDSQGFCCRCTSRRENLFLKRPNATCRHRDIATLLWHGYKTTDDGMIQQYGSSAHCLRMHHLWYDVYDIDPPILQYTIHVSLLEFNGVVENIETGEAAANWTLVSSFELNPSKTISKSPDGRVIAEIQGDLLGTHGPSDFSAKKLLIPSLKVFSRDRPKPAAYLNGPNDWMLVDESLVDLTGRQCNKVGTSFTAFRMQPTRCQQEPDSCFSNQPLQLWTYDWERIRNKKSGKYLLRNFGKVHPSTHSNNNSFILRFIHESLHNSFVTFKIDASDIQFVFNSVKGRIVDATAEDFTSLEENGLIIAEIENTGEIAGDFMVTLAHCHDDRVPTSKKQTLLPGQIANVSFVFQAFTRGSEQVHCVVELYDTAYNFLGTANVNLKVNASCFCYGECGCSCDEIGNATKFECPEEPPVVIEGGPIIVRLILLVLKLVGAHGIVGFFGGILLLLGFVKLLCGGVICCRKTKAQEHYDSLIEKGVDPNATKLVKCTGECRGARMAKARYKRKIERVRRLGKDPYRLDDWRNTSFVCNCNDELSDIRFINIIKALCFFYYCFLLPFIWIGRKMWWSVYRDTAKNKEAAKRSVLRSAKKQGRLEQYGMVDIGTEIKNVLKESEAAKAIEQKELAALSAKSGTKKSTSKTKGNQKASNEIELPGSSVGQPSKKQEGKDSMNREKDKGKGKKDKKDKRKGKDKQEKKKKAELLTTGLKNGRKAHGTLNQFPRGRPEPGHIKDDFPIWDDESKTTKRSRGVQPLSPETRRKQTGKQERSATKSNDKQEKRKKTELRKNGRQRQATSTRTRQIHSEKTSHHEDNFPVKSEEREHKPAVKELGSKHSLTSHKSNMFKEGSFAFDLEKLEESFSKTQAVLSPHHSEEITQELTDILRPLDSRHSVSSHESRKLQDKDDHISEHGSTSASNLASRHISTDSSHHSEPLQPLHSHSSHSTANIHNKDSLHTDPSHHSLHTASVHSNVTSSHSKLSISSSSKSNLTSSTSSTSTQSKSSQSPTSISTSSSSHTTTKSHISSSTHSSVNSTHTDKTSPPSDIPSHSTSNTDSSLNPSHTSLSTKSNEGTSSHETDNSVSDDTHSSSSQDSDHDSDNHSETSDNSTHSESSDDEVESSSGQETSETESDSSESSSKGSDTSSSVSTHSEASHSQTTSHTSTPESSGHSSSITHVESHIMDSYSSSITSNTGRQASFQ